MISSDLVRSLLRPNNPRLSIIMAFLNIAYGVVLCLPQGNDIYKFYPIDLSMGLSLFAFGLVQAIYIMKENYRLISTLVAINAVVWSVNTSFLFVERIYQPFWFMTLIISLYSIVVSSNIWVNYVYRVDKNKYGIMEKK